MADWTDNARAAGLSDAAIAARQEHYATLDGGRRYAWLLAANSASPATWTGSLATVRPGWTSSISASGVDTALLLDRTPPPTVATADVTATAERTAAGPLVRHTTTAASGVDAGLTTAAGIVRRQWLPSLHARITTDPTAVTSMRLWIGLASAELGGLDDDPTTQHVAAFRYDTDLDTTPYWRAVTCDGETATVTTTPASIAPDSSYELAIEADPSGTPVRFWANSVLVATHTTHLPGADADLACLVRLRTLAASARATRIGRIAWSLLR